MALKTCCKSLFLLLNGIIFILGLASLGVGIWMAVDADSFLDLTKIGSVETVTDGLVRVVGYIMIAGGGATTLFAILGIVGACRDNVCLLGLYIVLLVVALVLQVTAVVLGVVFKKEIEDDLDNKLKEAITKKYEGPGSKNVNEFTSGFNTFMAKMECCGIRNGSVDFADTDKWDKTQENKTAYVVPPVCCVDSYDCATYPNATNSYTDGCLDKVKDLLYKYHAVMIGISVGVVGFQFLLVILGLCVFAQRKPSYEMGK